MALLFAGRGAGWWERSCNKLIIFENKIKYFGIKKIEYLLNP